MNTSHLVSITFSKKIYKNPNVVSFYFHKPEDFVFLPGQYTRIYLTEDISDRSMVRSMSFSSAPYESVLRFTMRIDSGSPFKKALLNLQPGDLVSISNPEGKFILPEVFEKVYLIAGGVGITPFISMFRQLSYSSPQMLSRIAFYHISSQEFIFEDEYSALPIHSETANYIEMEHQLQDHKDYLCSAKSPFYISGSPRFVRGVRNILTDIGVDNNRITLDSFVGY